MILFLQGQYEDRIEFETNVSVQESDFVSVLIYENCIAATTQQYQNIIQLRQNCSKGTEIILEGGIVEFNMMILQIVNSKN